MLAALDGRYVSDWAPTLALGIEGIERERPAAILLDVGLPDAKDYRHAIAEVKEHRHDAAIIVVSGSDDPVVITQAIADNADAWVVKGSFTPKGLIHQIEEGIAKHRTCSKLSKEIKRLEG